MTRARDNSFNPLNNQVAGKNAVINGAFDFWQRGTSFASVSSGSYSADRWWFGAGGASNYTISRQTTSDTTNLPNIQYAVRLARASGDTSTSQIYFANVLETVNSIPLAAKTVSLSYYARVGSNYSGGNTFRIHAATGATTDVTLFSGVASNNAATSAPALTTTWQRFTASGTVFTNATQACVYFTWLPSGTAGANDWVEITGVQLEVGSTATHFSRAGGTIGGELSLCQRYYYKSSELQYSPGTATYTGVVRAGVNSAGTRWLGSFTLPVTMRSAPSAIIYNPLTGTASSVRNEDSNTNLTATIFGMYTNTITQIDLSATAANQSILGYIVASAEL